jgi:hypothetical protein
MCKSHKPLKFESYISKKDLTAIYDYVLSDKQKLKNKVKRCMKI